MGIGEAQWPRPDEDGGDHSIHRSAARDRDEEGEQCMPSALGEGDREGNDFCANLEDRDKETEIFGGVLLVLKNGAETLIVIRGNPMAVLDSKIRVRPDAKRGIVWIDSLESVPAGYGHQLTPEIAVRIGRELVAAARIVRDAAREKDVDWVASKRPR
jgi:hypothetical protein